MSATAVRVALRVRPLTQKEQYSSCTECITFIPNQPQILIGKDHSFTYDYIFDPKSSQKSIYDSSVVPLVEKFVDGFNATILAYGQTGSGKTFSMGTALDGNLHSEQQGIVPRFISDLFERMESKHQSSDDYQVYVSFLELYNEEFVDLLNTQDTSNFGNNRRRSQSAGSLPNTACEISIREDIQGNIYWTGVREEPCSDPDQLLSLLARGSLCRTTGSTDMNAVSSRSHAIFSVILKQQLDDDDQPDQQVPSKKTIISKFHFVDLAGSERLKRTNAQGDRAREGIAINSGLLALGNVISALGDESRKSAHVPYRDSKLTRLLQDSLGGNSQTLMMACVSPSDSNFPETLSTLKYANRARNIKNKVSINQEFAGTSVEVNQLRSLVGRLRMELNNLRSGNMGGMNSTSTGTADIGAVRALRDEVNRLRGRIQQVSDELRDTATQRDTLLIERDLGQWSSKDWPRLWEELEQLSNNHQDTNKQSSIPSSMEKKMDSSFGDHANPTAAVQMVVQYQRTIQQLRDELSDTQDRLAFFESTQAPMMQAMAMASNLTPSASLFSNNQKQNGRQSPSAIHRLAPQKQSSYRSRRGTARRRVVRHSGSASNRSRRSKVPATLHRRASPNPESFKSVVQQQQQKKTAGSGDSTTRFQAPLQPTTLGFEDDNEDIEQWLKDTIGPLSNDTTSDIRTEVRDSIQKARSEIEKGLKVLEDIKPRENAQFDCDILNDDELFERLKSDESNLYLGDLEQELTEGMWNDQNSSSQLTSSSNDDDLSIRHSRLSSVETTLSSDSAVDDKEMESFSIDNPQFARMMDQIQADIRVKEELVTQLEKSEVEYGQLRKRFQTKLYSLHEEIIHLKRERDSTYATLQQQLQQQQHQLQQQNRRSSLGGANNNNNNNAREHHQLHEVRHAYEVKMKNLLNQLSDLRRKYSQTSSAIQSSRNQNESMLRALRVNVESLKLEKRRMVKRMKDEAERVKEQMMAHEREIQQLRRKQTRHNECKHRLERETKQLQRLLQKRTDESTVTNERLKQLVYILKKAVCEGGILDEKLITKCSSFLNLGHLATSSLSRQQQRRSGSNNKKKSSYSKIPLEVRASKKKHLLDQALLQFIQGKQAILEMKQLMVKRDALAGEKSEIMLERADLLQGNTEATETLDIAVQQCMDERLETIDAEINYINARIYGLQNDAAHGLLQYDDPAHGADADEDDDMMMALEEQSMTSSLAQRIEKRVTFADEVMGHTTTTTTTNGKNSKTQQVDNNSGWQDIDQLEEKYSLPPGTDPDTAHDMAVQLLQSLTSDESNKIMEALIDDVVSLRLGEYGRQTTVRQLEKTVQDLRCTLFVMRKAANTSTAENEKKIRKLEQVRRLSVSSLGDGSVSSASSVILPPRRISVTDHHSNSDDNDSAIDLRVEDQHSGTIFDKIYNDGIRGAIMSPTWNEYHSREGKDDDDLNLETTNHQRHNSNDSMDSPILKPTATSTTTTTTTTSASNTADGSSTAGPMRPSVSPLTKRRDSMSSPEQFLQQMLQTNMINNNNVKDNTPRGPAEFVRYHAERESSTSSINSRHLRRSSLQSDTLSWSSHGSSQHHHPPPPPQQPQHYPTPLQSYFPQQQSLQQQTPTMASSIANRRRAHSLQLNQYPTKTGRRRSLLRELTLGVNIREANSHGPSSADVMTGGCHQPSPLQQQFRFSTTPEEQQRQQQHLQQQQQQQQSLIPVPTTQFSIQQQYQQRPASAFAMAPRNKYHHVLEAQKPRSQTPTVGGGIFDRLASTHTRASQAKRSPSVTGYRHSSGSFEEIQRRWEYEQSVQ
ncbi:uncharacterized protein BX664DRAFT_357800 [Halteromyces radiatus]|uniref:uncharacterized protein n=1 Tax=Halteromyces radiatus TaxID=101107 RepID=UPI00221FD45C|nr:uncharacterized protein BX664DRAFT_357800 [Halteromyces radiatus]KAI8093344.1 hypothetical protein BX664DRAFT_357800 [Halteromyces radiatus]